MVYMGRVAGRIRPVLVTVVVMSVMLVVLHGHVMVSTGLGDMVVVIQLLQERASRRREVRHGAVRGPGVVNLVNVMGLGDYSVIVTTWMIGEDIPDGLKVERRLKVSR